MLAIDQPYALLLVLAALIPAFLSVATIRHRPNLGARSFSILLAAVALWAFLSLFEVYSLDPQTKIFSYMVKYLFIVTVPPAWFIFTLHYSNRIRKLLKSRLIALLIMPVVALAMIGTNQFHHLMINHFEMVQSGGQYLLYPHFGPFFWVHTAYCYAVLLAGFFYLTKHLIDYPAAYRRPIISLIIGGLAPWISNIFFIFGIGPGNAYFDFTPIAFAVSGVAFTWGMLRYKLLDIIPIARDTVIQNIHDGIIVVDNDDQVIDINQTARRMLKMETTRFAGIRAESVFPWWDAFKRHRISLAENNLPTIQIEVDRNTHYFQLNRSPILVKHQLIGHVISLYDATAAHKARRALLESEARFKSLSENAPVIIFSLDENGAFSYVNPAWKTLLGYDNQDVLDKPFADFIPSENRQAVTETFRQIVDGRSSTAELNLRIFHKDGSRRLFDTSVSANSDMEGRVTGIIGLAKDVTEERRLQRQLIESQKMEAIGTLAGGIAHDFNNLLMGIQANLSLMRMETSSGPSYQEKIRRIEEQVNNGASLTRQLLGYARKGKYALKVLDLNVLIREALIVVNRTNKGVAVHQRLLERPAFVSADQGQIELVLLNLFINAVDAMPDGGDLRVSTSLTKNSEGLAPDAKPSCKSEFIKITVSDTGIGMDHATRQRIFEPFFTTKAMGRGTGLGLASVYGVVKNHGGSIAVHSEPGKGSTFSILLPAARQVCQLPVLPESNTTSICTGGTVLLVDDEPLILQYCQEMLKGLGYEVLAARDAETALRIYQTQSRNIDIAVLDMVMPKMGGLQLLEKLQAINPDIRAVISTGHAVDSRITGIIAGSRYQYLKKPYNSDALADAITHLMKIQPEMNVRAGVGAN